MSRRAGNHTQSREKCRRAGGQPNALRAAKHTQSREEWWRGASRAAKHTQSREELLEGARRTAKRTQSREEWCRGPGGQPNALRAREEWWRGALRQLCTLRAGRSGRGGREGSQAHSEPGGVFFQGGECLPCTLSSREEWWREIEELSRHTQSQEECMEGAGGHPSILS